MKKIKFYKNSNAMEEETIKEIISMSPLDRVKNAVKLIKRIYPAKPKITGMINIKILQ